MPIAADSLPVPILFTLNTLSSLLLQNATVTLVFWEELLDLYCLVNPKIQDNNKNIKTSKCFVKSEIHQRSKNHLD